MGTHSDETLGNISWDENDDKKNHPWFIMLDSIVANISTAWILFSYYSVWIDVNLNVNKSVNKLPTELAKKLSWKKWFNLRLVKNMSETWFIADSMNVEIFEKIKWHGAFSECYSIIYNS